MSVMSLAVVCSLGLLVIINAVGGMQLEPMPTKCQCLKVTSDRLNPKLFKKINIIPPQISCPRMEILITVMNNNTICINPNAKWFAGILKHLLKHKKGYEKTKS